MPRPVEEFYADAAFAGLYDAQNPWAPDFDFCARAAESAGSLLDLGCGTGQLATALAATVPRVVGVDPAATMLDFARSRPGSERVRWIEADATGLNLGETFDLVTMTGHAFQCLLTDDDQDAALTAMRSHLASGGCAIFDTRNPAPRPWESWTADLTRQSFTAEDGRRITKWTTSDYDAGREILAYTQHFLVPGSGEPRATTAYLRFASRERIEEALVAAGLRARAIHGDWTGAAWTPDSPEILVVAEPA